MANSKKELDDTKRLMGALVRMKPKQHEEMKVGKAKTKKAKSPAKKSASSKPKNA
jgi:hypothetical protein